MRSLAPILLLAVLLGACKSSHTLDQRFDLREDGERRYEIRFTETRHIDSVEDVNALSTDVWRVEHYAFPDSIRLFVRVLDSNGYVVYATHLREHGEPLRGGGVEHIHAVGQDVREDSQ